MRDKFFIACAVIGFIAITGKKSNNNTYTGNGNADTGNGNTDTGNNSKSCQGTNFLVNGKKICETVLPDMGYIWLEHPTIPNGWHHYTSFINKENLNNADFINYLKKGAKEILEGEENPEKIFSYTYTFKIIYKRIPPLVAA